MSLSAHQQSETEWWNMLTEIDRAREEASFEDAQKHSDDHHTSKILHQTSARHDYTPTKGQDAEVPGWPLELLQYDVARNLEKDVWDENLNVLAD